MTCEKTAMFGTRTCCLPKGHAGKCRTPFGTLWEQMPDPAVTRTYCGKCGDLNGQDNDGTQGGSAGGNSRPCACARPQPVAVPVAADDDASDCHVRGEADG